MTRDEIIRMARDALRAELDAMRGQKEEALNTLCRVFHAGEEFVGPDGVTMAVDLALWNEGCEAIESLVGDKEDDASPCARPVPAQSVPERITHDQAPHVYSQEAAEGYADGWNACVKKIVAAAPQNCIKAAMEAQREGCAEIVLQAAHKAADCNNLRDYELLRALSIEVAKAPEVKP